MRLILAWVPKRHLVCTVGEFIFLYCRIGTKPFWHTNPLTLFMANIHIFDSFYGIPNTQRRSGEMAPVQESFKDEKEEEEIHHTRCHSRKSILFAQKFWRAPLVLGMYYTRIYDAAYSLALKTIMRSRNTIPGLLLLLPLATHTL